MMLVTFALLPASCLTMLPQKFSAATTCNLDDDAAGTAAPAAPPVAATPSQAVATTTAARAAARNSRRQRARTRRVVAQRVRRMAPTPLHPGRHLIARNPQAE